MRFLDITAERFGILQHSGLTDLPSGMTVVYGANGSGKTTMVRFVEGLLFGYTTEHQAFQPSDESFGGSVSMEHDGRSMRLTRERSRGISSELSAVDLATGVSVSPGGCLPTWVTQPVFDQVFSVGDQEASQFDLLSRLCLEDSGAAASEEEIRRVELAIQQAIREREGDGTDGGLRQQISQLRTRRDDLARQLGQLRQLDPTIPARIAEIHAELQRLQSRLQVIDQEIRDIESRIRELEAQLVELRRQNSVSLNRREIEGAITRLQDRQNRWDEIRKAINRELSGLQTTSPELRNLESLKSIRALVSRLEQRMESLGGDQRLTSVAGTERDVFVDHIRSEVFSLCDYVAQHESAIESQEAALESLFGQRTLQDAESVNTILQGQIDALREELNRCEDIISVQPLTTNCQSPGHVQFRRTSGGVNVGGSIDELESELARLRRRLNDLQAERGQITAQIQQLQGQLSQLEAERRSAASLQDIDRLKAEIAEIDARLAILQERWEVLEETERNLREVLERLNEYQGPVVLDVASDYISRLTDGECYRLEADSSATQVEARTRQSTYPQGLNQLSRGTRDQVALALRLALIQVRSEDGRCPLILDDVFITSDDERATAVADLLIEIAASGQQIIFFTCQKDVRNLFERRNASVRILGEEHEPAPIPIAPVPMPVPASMPAPAPMPLVHVPQPLMAPVAPPAPVVADNTNWLFYLEVDNSIEDLSGLTVAEVEAIRASELSTIDDLMTASVDELESRFRNRGYGISRDRIRAWRGQAELSTLIPMLRRSDAELLYAAGIESALELSRMRPETVYERVSSFQDSQNGSRYRRSGRTIDRQQAINWSRWSQHSRSLNDARHSRSRFFVRSTDQTNSPHAAPANDRDGSRDRSEYATVGRRRSRVRQGEAKSRRLRRPSLSSDARQQRDRRQDRRRQRLAQHSSSYRTSEQSRDSSQEERELRFYLNRSDDVEAAPSIGPKTAQRLGRVGIYTVDDLLQANAVEVAAALDMKRISAEIIATWQAQAKLVCTIPEIRGHDAQILVACGITESEQLAGKRPADLYAVVGPFSETSEGERIIRGGKKPDLEEITDWIRFAQQARPLLSAA